MKNIVLYKHHPCRQLAHLYEHMYCHAITHFMDSKNLFINIDYSLNGTTFSDGSTVIELEVNNEAINDNVDQLQNIQIYVSQTSISSSLKQIESEKQSPVIIKNMEGVLEELAALNSTPWQNYGHHVRPPLGTRTTKQPIQSFEHAYQKPRSLSLRLELTHDFARDNRILLPFARLVFQAIAERTEMTIMDEFGISGLEAENYGWFGKKQYTQVDWLTYRQFNPDFEKLIQTLRNDIQTIHTGNGFDRLIASLHNLDYSDGLQWPPDIRATYYMGKYLPNADDWRVIATTKTCEAILKATTATFKFGNKQLTHHLD